MEFLESRIYRYVVEQRDDKEGVTLKDCKTFMEGEKLNTRLLRFMIEYRYLYCSSFDTSSDVISLSSIEDEMALYESLSTRPLLGQHRFSIKIVVYPYRASNVTSIIVVVPNKEKIPQNTLYVLSILDRHEAMKEPAYVHIVMNNRYAYQIDNGFFAFEFIDFIVRHVDDDASIPHNFYTENEATILGDPQKLAFSMATSLLRPKETEDRIHKLFLDITALVEQDNSDTKELEKLKQHLCLWVDYACDLRHDIKIPDESMLKNGFLELIEPDGVRLIIPENERPNVIVREMVKLIRFMLRVAFYEPGATLKIGNDPLDKQIIENQIKLLLFRLVAYIDSRNMPLTTEALWNQVGINIDDYRNLTGCLSISYDVMRLITRRGRRDGSVYFLRDDTKDDIISQNNALIFSVFEGRRALLVEITTGVSPAYALYVSPADMAIMDSLLDRADIITQGKCYRTELLCQTNLDTMTNPMYNDICMVLLMITNWDYMSNTQKMLDDTSKEILDKIHEQFIRIVRVAILEAHFKQPVVLIHDSDSDDACHNEDTRVSQLGGLNSSLADLVILNMKDQYISSNILFDMLKVLRREIKDDFFIVDSCLWGNMNEKNNKNRTISPQYEWFTTHNHILIIMNESKIHWALAIIDRSHASDGRVEYYTSSPGSSNFVTFQPLMKKFLAIQDPGRKYNFFVRKGQEQPQNSFDCAIYVLNEIIKVCAIDTTDLTRRRVFSVLSKVIRNSFRKNRDPVIKEINRLVCVEYFTPPKVWSNIGENAKLFAKFQLIFQQVLQTLLKYLDYTTDSIDKLIERLKSIKKCDTNDFFMAILEPENVEKRPREEEDCGRNKAQKCITEAGSHRPLEPDEIEVIRDKLSEMLQQKNKTTTKKKREKALPPITYFKRFYKPNVLEFFKKYIDLPDINVEKLIIFLYAEDRTADEMYTKFLELWDVYGRPSNEEPVRKNLSCIICATPTSHINLFLMQPFCSIVCLDRYCL